jgi:DNA-binding transcriptional ArsR family regulator
MGKSGEELIPFRAMAHPLRLRMLSLLTGSCLSAADLARELEIAHAAAHYHVRRLAAAGLVHEVDVPSVAAATNGRPPIRYRHNPAIEGRLDRSQGREPVAAAMVEDVNRRRRLMSRHRRAADAEVWLDPQDWEEVCILAGRIIDLIHGRARAPRAAGTVHGSATLAFFELAESASAREELSK